MSMVENELGIGILSELVMKKMRLSYRNKKSETRAALGDCDRCKE